MSTLDVEFIICWEDRTWTTEIKTFKEIDLPLDGNDGIAFDRLCDQYLQSIVSDLAKTDDIMKCPRGGPVHVGIYHVGEMND